MRRADSRPARGAARWSVLLLCVLIALFVYDWVDDLFEATTLVRPDEGRYAEIAREMAASGDWVTPRLNGLKYFEKPPLQYWGTAAAFQAFGVQPWVARIWPLLCALLSLVVVGFAAVRLRTVRDAIAIVGVLGSSLLYVMFGTVITLDMALAFWLTVAACAVALALDGEARARPSRWMLVAWAALAAAVLTKGLVGLVLPAMAACAYLLTTRQWGLLRRVRPVAGLLLLVALTAPWFVLVQQRNPEFFDFFFVHEHFQRFLTTEHRRTGAWWYFLVVGAIGFLPWTPMLGAWALTSTLGRTGSSARLAVGPASERDVPARRGARALLRRIYPESSPERFDADRWFACWVIVTVGFFSLSSSKLPGYIVPAFPALAWVVGLQWRRASNRSLVASIGVVIAVAGAVAVAMPWIGRALDARYEPALVAGFAAQLTESMVWLAAGCGVSIVLVLARRRTIAVFALSLAALACWDRVMDGVRLFSPMLSSERIVAEAFERERDALRSAPFYTVEVFDQTLPFYLGRAVVMVNVTDELAMGLRSEPERGIATVEEWAARWRTLEQGYAFMSGGAYRRLADAGVPARLVAEDRQRVIIARR